MAGIDFSGDDIDIVLPIGHELYTGVCRPKRRRTYHDEFGLEKDDPWSSLTMGVPMFETVDGVRTDRNSVGLPSPLPLPFPVSPAGTKRIRSGAESVITDPLFATDTDVLSPRAIRPEQSNPPETRTETDDSDNPTATVSVRRSRRAAAGRHIFCDVCGAKFDTEAKLKKHRPIHKDEDTPFACADCGRLFTTRYIMRKHIERYHKYPLHRCKKCGTNFHSLKDLRLHHLHGHVDASRPHKCFECGKSFAKENWLFRHIQGVHEKIKTFQCKQCSKSFVWDQQLRDHIAREHLKEPPHACNYCSLKFIRVYELRKHLRVVHGF
jgi:DNA-directed RNA polymerase subunit RPC12/RpoP